MFKRTRPIANPVAIQFDEQSVTADQGDTVATALLAHGVAVFHHSAVTAEPRGPLCLIGNCFGCLVNIDGEPNRQACRELVREGMVIRTQHGLWGGEVEAGEQ